MGSELCECACLLISCQTRQKLKEAFDIHMAAVVERAEKQIILARHARRLLNYVDDTPVVPGDARQAYGHELEARQVLEDAENDLRAWRPSLEPIPTSTDQESHVNGLAEHEPGATNEVDSESMVKDTPSSKKQVDEPQAPMSEAQTVPLAS